MIRLLIFLSILICGASCTEKSSLSKDEFIKSYKELDIFQETVNKKIIFPESISPYNKFEISQEALNEGAKIITILKCGCQSSLLEVAKWDSLMKADPVFKEVDFITLLRKEDSYYIKHQLTEKNQYPFAIYHDPGDNFLKENSLPNYASTNNITILVNDENRILLVGSPHTGLGMINLYKDKILEIKKQTGL